MLTNYCEERNTLIPVIQFILCIKTKQSTGENGSSDYKLVVQGIGYRICYCSKTPDLDNQLVNVVELVARRLVATCSTVSQSNLCHGRHTAELASML